MENLLVGNAFEDLSFEEMQLSQGAEIGAHVSSTPIAVSIKFSVWSSVGCATGGAVSVVSGISVSVGLTR
ncbi:MAG: lichenicidin A2 family type 2 lantibiotic [Defluviitaleaceae bacterium]|nr:lichenicidin A2 family type 2 lantibiotic [Defluviitaleaceae bacterium]